MSSLKWLEENFLVKEAIINGQSDFMVNPDYATIGKNKKIRVAEWNRRCQAYIKKLEDKTKKNLPKILQSRLEFVTDAPNRD